MEPIIETKYNNLQVKTGAHFWVNVSTLNNSNDNISKWKVKLIHTKSNWSAEVSSKNPAENLETPGLSGIFNVEIFASGPCFSWQSIGVLEGYSTTIGCDENCGSMIELLSNKSGSSIHYTTHWNVVCKDLDLVIPELDFE